MTVFDEDAWSFEPSDYSVGIFGEAWVHETCTAEEYDEGCTADSRFTDRVVRKGAVYATEIVTVSCHDCSTSMSFDHEVLMGFEHEVG